MLTVLCRVHLQMDYILYNIAYAYWYMIYHGILIRWNISSYKAAICIPKVYPAWDGPQPLQHLDETWSGWRPHLDLPICRRKCNQQSSGLHTFYKSAGVSARPGLHESLSSCAAWLTCKRWKTSNRLCTLPKPLEGSEASHDLTQRQTWRKNLMTLFLSGVAAIVFKHTLGIWRGACVMSATEGGHKGGVYI